MLGTALPALAFLPDGFWEVELTRLTGVGAGLAVDPVLAHADGCSDAEAREFATGWAVDEGRFANWAGCQKAAPSAELKAALAYFTEGTASQFGRYHLTVLDSCQDG